MNVETEMSVESCTMAREAIVLSALPVGFFGVLFGLRFGMGGPDVLVGEQVGAPQ